MPRLAQGNLTPHCAPHIKTAPPVPQPTLDPLSHPRLALLHAIDTISWLLLYYCNVPMHAFSLPGRPHRTISLKIQPDDRASLNQNHHTPPALLSPCLSSNCATLEGGSCLPLAPIGRFRARRRCCRARVRSVGTFHARRPLVAAGARHASERRELTLGARR